MNKYKKTLIGIATAFLLCSSTGWTQSTLTSIKKGGEGERSWIVLSFNQKAIWSGISRLQGMKGYALYFMGNAGILDGERRSINPINGPDLLVEQVSTDPEVMKVTVTCDAATQLTVLNNNRYVVVSFNDDRFVQSAALQTIEDVSPTQGELVSVVQRSSNSNFIASMTFNGSYEWYGFIQPVSHAAALLIRGATNTGRSDISYTNAALRRIRIFNDEGEHPGLKAVLFFQDGNPYTIVKKGSQMLVETVSLGGTPQEKVLLASREQSGAVTVTPSAKMNEEDWKKIDDLLTGAPPAASAEPEAAPQEQKQTEPAINQSGQGKQVEKEQPAVQEEVNEKPVQEKPKDFTPVEEKTNRIPWDERVTFRFDNTDLNKAVRTVANLYNLNVVFYEGLEGKVTVDLHDVTLRQALDKMIYPLNAEYLEDDGIIMVRPMNMSYVGGMKTRVFRLQYAEAENVAPIIKQVVSNDSLVQVFHPEFLNVEKGGTKRQESNKITIQGVSRTSVLVVTETPGKLNEVADVIKELDRAPVKVIIHSKLVEMSPLNSNKLGIDWDKTITMALNQVDQLADGSKIGYSLLNDAPGSGGTVELGHLTASKFQAVLDFLQERSDVKLKSNPSLLTNDNEESSISVGTTVPVPKIQRGFGGQGDMVTFDYKEVNIQMNVTPHVTEDNKITMFVNPVIEEITGWVEFQGNQAPITDKRSVNSIVTINNGETVVIGGLVKSQQTRTLKKVWFLGSLPLLGKLFQHEENEDKQTDLMIFITPEVVHEG